MVLVMFGNITCLVRGLDRAIFAHHALHGGLREVGRDIRLLLILDIRIRALSQACKPTAWFVVVSVMDPITMSVSVASPLGLASYLSKS